MKHSEAQILFDEGIDQKRIAQVMGVSEQTVINWKKKFQWEKKRIEKSNIRETAEDSLWELINYQLDQLKALKAAWLKEKKVRLIDKGDIDALTKMFAAVKGKQLEWSAYVKIIKELNEFLQNEDLNLTKKVTPLMTQFLAQKRKDL